MTRSILRETEGNSCRGTEHDPIRESRHLERFFREVPVGFLVFSLVGSNRFKLDYANREAEKLLGIEHENGREMQFSDLFFGSQERRLTPNLLKVLKTGRRFETDEAFYGNDSTIRYLYRFTAYSLSYETLVVVLIDITAQRGLETELRENRQRLKTLTDAAFDAIVMHRQGTILYGNPAFSSVFGIRQSQLIGRRLDDFIVKRPRNLISVATSKRSNYRYKTEGLRKDGSTFPIEIIERDCRVGGRGAQLTVIRSVENRELLKALEAENRTLSQLSIRDGLTELANHRYFKLCLMREIERCRRTGSPLSLIMIDIDHFKSLNDRYGHQVGDDVLIRIAKILREKRRISDIVARYGGEEFAILLPDTPRGAAAKVAERLRARIAERKFVCGERRLNREVTLSFGVASAPSDATESAQLIYAADSALYAAKRLGRDRVELASNSDKWRATSGVAMNPEVLVVNYP